MKGSLSEQEAPAASHLSPGKLYPGGRRLGSHPISATLGHMNGKVSHTLGLNFLIGKLGC